MPDSQTANMERQILRAQKILEERRRADEAWGAFVKGAKAFSHHLDQWEKIKFKTEYGMVYVSIGRDDPYPDSFEEISNGQ